MRRYILGKAGGAAGIICSRFVSRIDIDPWRIGRTSNSLPNRCIFLPLSVAPVNDRR
jgi:hypothetical protein